MILLVIHETILSHQLMCTAIKKSTSIEDFKDNFIRNETKAR